MTRDPITPPAGLIPPPDEPKPKRKRAPRKPKPAPAVEPDETVEPTDG